MSLNGSHTNRNRRKIICLFIGVCIIGLAFSACDAEVPTGTITAEEFRFSPKRLELPAHQIVRLILRNQGRERHVFQSPILTGKDVIFDRNSLAGRWKGADEIQIHPGERIELSLVLPEGLYPYRCKIRGHKGMEGTLVVEK